SAVVTALLVGDALGDVLCALEAAGRVEVGALAAGVELGAAVRALGERIGRDRQHTGTLRAARGGARLQDAERPGRRPRRIVPLRASAPTAAPPIALLPVLAVAHPRCCR